MKIKHFSLKDGTTRQELLDFGFKPGGSWVTGEKADLYYENIFKIKKSKFSFSVTIVINKELSDWNDYDNILVLDESFLQPYTAFYSIEKDGDIPDIPVLEQVVKQYNKFMSGLPFLEQKG